MKGCQLFDSVLRYSGVLAGLCLCLCKFSFPLKKILLWSKAQAPKQLCVDGLHWSTIASLRRLQFITHNQNKNSVSRIIVINWLRVVVHCLQCSLWPFEAKWKFYQQGGHCGEGLGRLQSTPSTLKHPPKKNGRTTPLTPFSPYTNPPHDNNTA